MAKAFPLLILLAAASLRCLAQDTLPPDPSPVEFLYSIETEPEVLNLQEVTDRVKETDLTAEVEGRFVVRILVDADGNYKNHLVLRSPHWRVTETYVAQLHHLRFTPATVGGVPKPCWVTLAFRREWR